MKTSSTNETPFAIIRRRRQARLRKSIDSCQEESVDSSETTWVNMENRSSSMRNYGVEIVSKRREANARERLRVRNLNSGFAKLRRILPTVPPNRKPSKVDTLQEAIDYIYQLEKILDATGGIPNIAKSFGASPHTHSRQSVTERPFFDDVFNEPSPIVRYVPPFNGCSHSCSDAHHDRFYPVNQSFNTQCYAGISYLPVPLPDYARSRHSPSSGHHSPASSLTSEESYYGDTNTISTPVEQFHHPRSPPLLFSFSSTTNTYSVSEVHDETTESTWAVVNRKKWYSWKQNEDNSDQRTAKEENKWRQPERIVNQSNNCDITESGRNQPVLPPVSFLYNVTVDA